MLRSVFLLLVTASALMAVNARADVYKFIDEKGNVQYTDKPRTLPAERLSVQSQKTDNAAAVARSQAELKQLQENAAARTQTTSQASEDKQADETMAKDRAERCVKARERFEKYSTSHRLYEQQPDGTRRYLTDTELAGARDNAKSTMDELCK